MKWASRLRRLTQKGVLRSITFHAGPPFLSLTYETTREHISEINLAIDLPVGRREFFIKETAKGWIFGPCNEELKAGRDDHLTVGLDERGEFAQIHRTIDRRHIWWHNDDSIQAAWAAFWKSRLEDRDLSLLFQPNTYIISWRRFVVFGTFLSLLTRVGISLLVRTVLNYETAQPKEHVERAKIGFDKQRAVSAMRFPIMLLSVVVQLGIQGKLWKVFLIKPNNYKRLVHDPAILISHQSSGFARLNKKGTLSFVPFTAWEELLRRVEQALPLGRLNELTDINERTTIEVSARASD